MAFIKLESTSFSPRKSSLCNSSWLTSRAHMKQQLTACIFLSSNTNPYLQLEYPHLRTHSQKVIKWHKFRIFTEYPAMIYWVGYTHKSGWNVHLWCDVLKHTKYNLSASDKLLNYRIYSALDLLRDRIWMIYNHREQSVYSQKVWHLVHLK